MVAFFWSARSKSAERLGGSMVVGEEFRSVTSLCGYPRYTVEPCSNGARVGSVGRWTGLVGARPASPVLDSVLRLLLVHPRPCRVIIQSPSNARPVALTLGACVTDLHYTTTMTWLAIARLISLTDAFFYSSHSTPCPPKGWGWGGCLYPSFRTPHPSHPILRP